MPILSGRTGAHAGAVPLVRFSFLRPAETRPLGATHAMGTLQHNQGELDMGLRESPRRLK